MKRTRALIPAAAAVAALALAGCSSTSGSPSTDASGSDCLASGSASEAVALTGDVGVDLELTSDTPVSVDEMERSVIEEGSGDVVEEGQSVSVSMTMFNGSTGEVMQQMPETPVPFAQAQLAGWAYEGMRCAVPGQQTVVVAPFSDAFQGYTPEQTGFDVSEDDSFVIAMQFGEIGDAPEAAGQPGTLGEDELLAKAEGEAQPAPEGFPEVELDADGAPTITMPEGAEPPAELSIATLIEGDGEVVEPGDRVYVNYRGVIWRTGEEFDSSWSRGAPTDFLTTQVIGGFQQALEGQKVGSQIISVVPAEDGGYGAAWLEDKGYEPDDVMVFVLDILGTAHAE